MAEFYLDYAAHVENPISHSTEWKRYTLAATGVVVATFATIMTGGGTILVMSAAVTWGAIGKDVGELADKWGPPVVGGDKIKSGNQTLFLGVGIRAAARAQSDDTKVTCHDKPILEGSTTVVLGPDFKPLARRQDRTKCSGLIADGLQSVLVGGVPSERGTEIREEDSAGMKLLGRTLNVLGILTAWKSAAGWLAKTRASLQTASFAAEETGNPKTAAALGLAASDPSAGVTAAADTAKNVRKAVDEFSRP